MIRNGSERKGTTSIELLTSSFLLAVVLTFCALLFMSSLRQYRNSTTKNDIKNAATIGLAMFGRDFRETSFTHIVNNTEGVAMPGRFFYFPSPRDREGKYQRSATGETIWSSWIIYYIPVKDTITLDNKESVYYLARRVISPASLMVSPAGFDIQTLQGAQVVARNVFDFHINKIAVSEYIYSYDVFVETKGYNAGNLYTFRVNETFSAYDLVNFIKR